MYVCICQHLFVLLPVTVAIDTFVYDKLLLSVTL